MEHGVDAVLHQTHLRGLRQRQRRRQLDQLLWYAIARGLPDRLIEALLKR